MQPISDEYLFQALIASYFGEINLQIISQQFIWTPLQ